MTCFVIAHTVSKIGIFDCPLVINRTSTNVCVSPNTFVPSYQHSALLAYIAECYVVVKTHFAFH